MKATYYSAQADVQPVAHTIYTTTLSTSYICLVFDTLSVSEGWSLSIMTNFTLLKAQSLMILFVDPF